MQYILFDSFLSATTHASFLVNYSSQLCILASSYFAFKIQLNYFLCDTFHNSPANLRCLSCVFLWLCVYISSHFLFMIQLVFHSPWHIMCSINHCYLNFFFSTSSILFSFVFLWGRCSFCSVYSRLTFLWFLGNKWFNFYEFFLVHRGLICFNMYSTSEYEQFLILIFFILSSPLYSLFIAVYFIFKQVLIPLTGLYYYSSIS